MRDPLARLDEIHKLLAYIEQFSKTFKIILKKIANNALS